MKRPERRFYFRLALSLGMTVKELLGRIDSAEIAEWLAYYQVEPFGEERADLRAGIVASTIANANSRKRKFRPRDFMPKFGRKTAAQSTEQMKAIVQRLKTAFGSKKNADNRKP